MNDNDKSEKSGSRNKLGVNIPTPTIRLSDKHPCCGCVWYSKGTNVLFCPFHNCVRNKKGFKLQRKR